MRAANDAGLRPREDAIVVVCRVCGTGYTERAWTWLTDLGAQRVAADERAWLDLRRCAVPLCCNTLARPVAEVPWPCE